MAWSAPAFWRLCLTLLLCGWFGVAGARGYPGSDPGTTVALAQLPAEARATLRLIEAGGPFPHERKDGSVFGNFEKRLPAQPRGYYREYTVPTPGLTHRGARRIVSGGHPPLEFYYTDDHYRSFRRIIE